MRRVKGFTLAVLVAILSWAGYPTNAEALIIIDGPGNGTAQAVRLNPPPPPPPPVLWTTEAVNGRCVGLIGALTYWSPGWDVNRMAGIAYRESRCQPSASNSCCSGVLQMHRMHVPEPSCGVYSRSDLYDPWKNICAAAELWRSSGYSAWSTS